MKRIYKHTGQVLAVAAFSTMGAAHAYEWQINPDTTFGIGGTVELAYTVNEDASTGSHSRELIDNGSGLVFSGEHAFTNDLSAYFDAEFDFAIDEPNGNGDNSFSTDHAFFGVASDRYGAVQVGNWDGIYDNTIRDLMDVFEVVEVGLNTAGYSNTIENGDSVAYFSPSVNGLSFAVQGTLKGADNPTNEDGQAFQAVVNYEAEQFGVFAGYHGKGLDKGSDGIIGVGAVVDLAPVTLSGKIEHVGEDSDPEALAFDKEGFMSYGVAASYDYGPGAITGAIRQLEPEDSNLDSRTKIGVNVNYEIADNFYVYVEHARNDLDTDNGYGSASAAGMVYAF